MNLSPLPLLSLLLLAAGCSAKSSEVLLADAGGAIGKGSSPPDPSAALVWAVSPGAHVSACGAVNDTFAIGNPEGSPIVTAPSGSSVDGVPVTVNCAVSPNGTGYAVTANVQYGNEGSLTIEGQINVAPSATPGAQTGIRGNFNDRVPGGLIADLTDTNCTITFTRNPKMGIAATRIWGVIDCPQASAQSGEVCDGNAEFLFENCGQ